MKGVAMSNKLVCFVAFEEQDNLGIGYLASVLLQAGFDIKIIDFRLGKEDILERLDLYSPLLVGFSIIFQYHIEDFKDLINHLRDNGMNCHFSAGGHYPSLRYNELLQIIPQLDSVVLFEGEYTFLELVQSIYAGKDWKYIDGIAYRENSSIIANPLRPLEKDLDNFPLPVRQPSKEYALGKKYATILAGRGCLYDCSFCSIREFYSKPAGPVKRVRRPEMVVREMELLQEHKDCSIFMFQDDDFPVARKKWVTKFCELLTEKGLSERILWKINCRPDEVEADTCELMRNCGLFLVYVGIESGTDDGLLLMNKRMKAETSIEAVNILKQLGIDYDYGFMLFDPSSTHQSVFDNLDFLETICGGGSSPITFCKMLPYAGTKIELELRKEGRLKGRTGFYDYDFLDSSLNYLYSFMVDCFGDWIMKRDGLLNASRWARYYLTVYEKYFPPNLIVRDLDKAVHEIVSQSNRYFINTARRLVSIFCSNDYQESIDILGVVKDDVSTKHSEYRMELGEVFDSLDSLSKQEYIQLK
ncbi:MAG: cobalamin-dependent protein [Candidatus Bathyarchaeota archaeon]|nr:MAG: cobalamin-dependent protein [Candidatus Bathyarchaeota archaeon]